MLLVIGPTCAGKSTYIETLRKDAAADGRELEIHFGFEVRRGKEVPTGPDDVVHANLLKGGTANSRADEDVVQIAPGQRQDSPGPPSGRSSRRTTRSTPTRTTTASAGRPCSRACTWPRSTSSWR